MMLLWQKRAMVNVVNMRCTSVHANRRIRRTWIPPVVVLYQSRLGHEPRYSEVVGDLVQPAQQCRCYGNSSAGSLDPRFMAAFAGHPDTVYA
jgi:hypothetical protein